MSMLSVIDRLDNCAEGRDFPLTSWVRVNHVCSTPSKVNRTWPSSSDHAGRAQNPAPSADARRRRESACFMGRFLPVSLIGAHLGHGDIEGQIDVERVVGIGIAMID